LDEAEKYYSKALQIADDYYAEIGLALILKERREYSKALDKMMRLFNADKSNFRLVNEITDTYIAIGDRLNAFKFLSDVFKEKNSKTIYQNTKVLDLYEELVKEFQ